MIWTLATTIATFLTPLSSMAFTKTELAVILVFTILIVRAGEQSYSIDEAYLFNKEPRLDRITIKNQIAYHFQQKAIREVTQELFISRLINIGPILNGLAVIHHAAENMQQYCSSSWVATKEIGRAFEMDRSISDPEEIETFFNTFYIVSRRYHTYSEAKARCNAIGKQLPEIYHESTSSALSKFLIANLLAEVFIGIEYDPVDNVFRHVRTALPSWYGYFQFPDRTIEPNYLLRQEPNFGWRHARFTFSPASSIGNAFIRFAVGNETKEKSFPFFDGREEKRAAVVCQDTWSGEIFELNGPTSPRAYVMVPGRIFRPEVNTTRYYRSTNDAWTRSKTPKIAKPTKLGSYALTTEGDLAQTCNATLNRLVDFYTDSRKNLRGLLQQVDISVNIHDENEDHLRKKRFAPMALKVLFHKGTKLLWGLFGFWQQLQTDRKIKNNKKRIASLDLRLNKTEQVLKDHQGKLEDNRREIETVTSLVKDQSIIISDLITVTAGMEKRIANVETSITSIMKDIDIVKSIQDIANTLLLVNTLSDRVIRSIDSAYRQLEDVIHTSLRGQTSPLVLPIDQMEEVQNVMNKLQLNSAIDKDYSKMQSIVTVDPDDARYLLVIVNAAAVSTQKMELVHLIPIPYFDETKGYSPVIEYNYAALNQISNTFTALTDEEAENCVTGRCYIEQMEQDLSSQSCGMPQFEDRSLESCDVESFPHNGMFVQAANPDGVVFSFRDKVKTQIYCRTNHVKLPQDTISGAGKLFVPPGCVLKVVDAAGKMVKVKGGPSHHLITVSDIELTNDALLVMGNSEQPERDKLRRPNTETSWEKQFSYVQSSLDTTHRSVHELNQRLWITIGGSFSIVLFLVTIIAVFFKYSRKFQTRFKKLVGGIKTLASKVADLEAVKDSVRTLAQQIQPKPSFRQRWGLSPLAPMLPVENDYLQMTTEDNVRAPKTTSVAIQPAPRTQVYPTCDLELEQKLLKETESVANFSTTASTGENDYVSAGQLK